MDTISQKKWLKKGASRAAGGILLAALLINSHAYAGDIAIIVNKSNTEAIDIVKLKKIFTKEYRIWKSGKDIVPIDLKDGKDTYGDFIKNVIGKSEKQIKSYWIQQKITKNIKEPLSFKGSSKVKSFVSKIDNAVGYIPKEEVDDSVRVVIEIN